MEKKKKNCPSGEIQISEKGEDTAKLIANTEENGRLKVIKSKVGNI